MSDQPTSQRPPGIERANPAVQAEPAGIGSSSAPDALSREIKLLGALLGQVIAEQAGEEILALVERVRRLTIDIRRNPSPTRQLGLRAILEELSAGQVEALIKAFSLYFHLTNLAEEKHRVRRVRKRARTAHGGQEGSIEAAIRQLLATDAPDQLQALLEGLSIGLVLTAHPTEARRRTVLVALRRTFALIDRLDDPRLTPNEDAEIRRHLREEISLLWRTSALRTERPSPLDEVRTALLFFDETLFRVTPYLYRTVDRVLDLAPGSAPRRVRPNEPGQPATAATPARGPRPSTPTCAGVPGWEPIATDTRASPPIPPGPPRPSAPTTSCEALSTWPRG